MTPMVISVTSPPAISTPSVMAGRAFRRRIFRNAATSAPVHAPVELYISDRNQELLIEVADRGCGVEDAMKPHIFRQGFSSKPDSENDIVGTEHGIGLYLVAGYIDKAGGSIEIADNTPQGTIFSVFIPNGQKHDPST